MQKKPPTPDEGLTQKHEQIYNIARKVHIAIPSGEEAKQGGSKQGSKKVTQGAKSVRKKKSKNNKKQR